MHERSAVNIIFKTFSSVISHGCIWPMKNLCHLLWPPYVIGQAIIFLPCGFYLSFFFSSPNLSGRRLDVFRTSTHGMALVRIWNAGLKCTARGSLEIQDAKNRHFGCIAQLCRAICSESRHVSTIGKKTF